jgi:hypothetical protein
MDDGSVSRRWRALVGPRRGCARLAHLGLLGVLSLMTVVVLAPRPDARAQDEDCTDAYQAGLAAWASFLNDPATPQPALPNPQCPCYASMAQALQDALLAWNQSRILALAAPTSTALPAAPPAVRTATPALAAATPTPTVAGAGQALASLASCTQPQFIVAPPSVRQGETAVIIITGFSPGSSVTLSVAGLSHGTTVRLQAVASAECTVVIGGDAPSSLPADTYQFRASGMSYYGRPLEMMGGLTVR